MILNYSIKVIDDLFSYYENIFGRDYAMYKNHVYRVYYNCILLDGDAANTEKYAYASFFHDLGIWTGNTIDYLLPSINEACSICDTTKMAVAAVPLCILAS